jgi:AraC family transcriptional regulator
MPTTNLDIILSSIQYIEERIRENITVSDIADDVGYSCYHYIRLFSGVTGFTPKEYLLKRKLSEAAKEILCSDRKIIDIAFEYDFQSHESFSRAFQREFGDSPVAFRKQRCFPDGLLLEQLSQEKLFKFASKIAEPEIVSLEKICFIGLESRIRGNYSEIGKMWSTLSAGLPEIGRKTVPEEFYQLNYCDKSFPEGEFLCMAAVAAPDLADIPIRFVGKTLPAAKYLKFTHKGLSSRVVQTYDFIYSKYLPGTSYKLTLPYNFEVYGKKYKGPCNPESESGIFIPIE